MRKVRINDLRYIPLVVMLAAGLLAAPALAQTDGVATGPAKTVAATMHVGATVNSERINVRTGPGADYARATLVDKEARVTITARRGDYAQVKLPGGATGWIGVQFLTPDKPLPGAAAPPAAAAAPQTPAAAASIAPDAAPAEAPARPAIRKAARKAAAPAADKSGDPLAGAKTDILQNTQESPAGSIGDGLRMVLYLLPILAIVLLAIRGLKAVQQRTGGLPSLPGLPGMGGLRRGMIGGLNLANARALGGSNIRVVESVPIGGASLHLVEVRGHTLLVGAAGSSIVNLLELKESDTDRNSEFQALLNSVNNDVEGDYDDEGSLGAVVGSLDDSLRDVRETIARAQARQRHWTEEDEDETNANGGGAGRGSSHKQGGNGARG